MKMSHRKKSSNKEPFLIAGIAILSIFIAAAVYVYWYAHRPTIASAQTTASSPTNTVNYGPATEQEKAASATAKQETISETDKPPASGTISVIISRASQVDSVMSVRSVVSGTQTGSCDITFTKRGQTTITKNFTIAQGPTVATCNGDVPLGEFTAGGNWSLSVVAKNNTTTSQPATQTVSVTK